MDTEQEASRQAEIIMANARRQAKDARKNGATGAVGSLLEAGGSVAGMF
jgi:hypothetical protein